MKVNLRQKVGKFQEKIPGLKIFPMSKIGPFGPTFEMQAHTYGEVFEVRNVFC